MIEPRTLKGFRDYLPELMIPREKILNTAREIYRSYGFVPIDTPALEYAEVLVGKGGDESDKLIYRFTDHGDRDVALRFDLTVPFARFAAQHCPTLGIPFKRYHMGPVWRGENTGQGRYREFWQCDFDCIGTTSNASDIEVALVIHDLFQAIGFDQFEIRINNRLVLNGLLEHLGLLEKATLILRSLDKLLKIGREKVCAEMVSQSGIPMEQANEIVALADLTGTNESILKQVEEKFGSNPNTAKGLRNLRELLNVAQKLGLPEKRFRIDLSICRGLDYYTGTIYETFLLDPFTNEKGEIKSLQEFGSVCSGGRYDNLAGLFTKQLLPGVGASLGLDRLIAAMEVGKLLPKSSTTAKVLIAYFQADQQAEYQRLARKLRENGIACDFFPEAKKLGSQLQFAEKRGFQIVLIAGSEEFSQKVWKAKKLATREESMIPEAQIIEKIKSLLEG